MFVFEKFKSCLRKKKSMILSFIVIPIFFLPEFFNEEIASMLLSGMQKALQ